MDQVIVDAIEELGGENKEFITEYLTWVDSVEGVTLQLDRPLVRIQRDGYQIAVLNFTTATLAITRTDDA